MEGLKEDLSSLIDYSHKTKSVAECYKPVRELIDEDTLKDYLPGCWITLIKVNHTSCYRLVILCPRYNRVLPKHN